MSRRPWAAVLTPAGRSAVATIAVEGPCAVEQVEPLFVSASGRRLSRLDVGAIAFGCWGKPRGEEIVVCRTTRGVEIHCHGGAASSSAILESLSPQVDIATTPTPWLEAEYPGRIEQTAVLALASSSTLPTAARLLSQLHGALRRELDLVVSDLRSENARRAQDRLKSLLEEAPFGQHLTEPWQVVLSGPPNAGKSSLINRILGYERAVVFDQPGTTRDVVSSISPLDGWPVLWCDTAGIREAKDDLEQQGVERALDVGRRADCMLRVLDVEQWRRQAAPDSGESADAIQVINKIDLARDVRLPQGSVGVSAATGQGVSELLELVSRKLTGRAPSDFDRPLLFTKEQVESVETAYTALETLDRQVALETLLEMLR